MAIHPKKKTSVPKIPKIILITAKSLAFVSPKLVTLFSAQLFSTPLRHKMPKREIEMDQKSTQHKIQIHSIDKEVIVYQYGNSDKKIILVHGWSGRGTQLSKMAEVLLQSGYSTISFDAPAHGKSPGKTTLMPDFIATILQLEKQFGPFEAGVGHSLGGMSLLNAVKKGLQLQKLVTIGSGDVVQDIMDDFIQKLKLKPEISGAMRNHFEKKSGETMDSYSAYLSAKEIEIPVLVIHDANDNEVPVSAGIHIHKYLKNGELMITKELGHRKILGDAAVISKTVDFIKN